MNKNKEENLLLAGGARIFYFVKTRRKILSSPEGLGFLLRKNKEENPLLAGGLGFLLRKNKED